MKRETTRPRKRDYKTLFSRLIALCLILSVVGVAGLVGGYYYLARDLPALYELKNYKPPIITQVYAADGTLIAEYAEEKRRMVSFDEIPVHTRWAFVAAEDKRFYEHKGVDFKGIIRALLRDIQEMKLAEGASTISQQVARNFFLNREKNFTRKIKEAILAVRMERFLTKDQILNIYLNQVDLGNNYFGIGAAAEFYFGKNVSDLTMGESAMLAGTLPGPSLYNPVSNFDLARSRERIVLNIMTQPISGFTVKPLTPEQVRETLDEPIHVMGQRGPYGEAAPYFTEWVRRLLVDRYGRDKVYQEGLKVFTTVDLKADAAAAQAVRHGVLRDHGVDKSLGYRPSEEKDKRHLEPAEIEPALEKQEKIYRRNWKRDLKDQRLAEAKGVPLFTDLKDARTLGAWDLPFPVQAMVIVPDPIPLQDDEQYKAVVAKVDDSKFEVWVLTGHSRGKIDKKGMWWAAPYKKNQSGNRLRRPSDILAPGDVVLVKIKSREQDAKGEPFYKFNLEQQPVVQAGLISMSTRTGHVKALAGGLDFRKSSYIRPVQAKRQPGSSMKPLIYAAALDFDYQLMRGKYDLAPEKARLHYTPATLLYDTAMVLDKGSQSCGVTIQESYRPRNYENTFFGPMTLQRALAHSVNTIAVRIGWDICPLYAIDYAHSLGIESPLMALPCLPLGCEEVRLEELAEAYNVFASGGYKMEPRYILRVYDRDGNLLEYEERPRDEDDQDDTTGADDSDTIGPPKTSDPTGLHEEDIRPGERSPSLTGRRYLVLPKPESPAERGEPTWEEYLAEISNPDRPWLEPVSTPPSGDQVMSPQTAYLMTYLLRTVVTEGTGQQALRIRQKVVGKTGTTNDYHDALFMGYSPELLTGVWVGADVWKYSLGRGSSGGRTALPIWIDFMDQMLKDRKPVPFPVPPDIEWVDIDTDTGLRAAEYTDPSKVKTYPFKKGTAPTEYSPPPAIDPTLVMPGGVAPSHPDEILDQ